MKTTILSSRTPLATLTLALCLGSGMVGTAAAESPLRDQILTHIAEAQNSVDVVVYEFRSDAIAHALAAAAQRGVRVRVVVDDTRGEGSSSQIRYLQDQNISVKKIASAGGMMHDKFVLFDQTTVVSPSYNYSIRTLQDTEDLSGLFTTEEDQLQKFKKQFLNIWFSSDFVQLPDKDIS